MLKSSYREEDGMEENRKKKGTMEGRVERIKEEEKKRVRERK